MVILNFFFEIATVTVEFEKSDVKVGRIDFYNIYIIYDIYFRKYHIIIIIVI